MEKPCDIIPLIKQSQKSFPFFHPWTTQVTEWGDGDFMINSWHSKDGYRHTLHYHSSVTPWGIIYRKEQIITTEFSMSQDISILPFSGFEEDVLAFSKNTGGIDGS